MKVRFAEIPEEGLRFEINDEAWFPDKELPRTGPVHAIVKLKRNGFDRVILEGGIKATIGLDCDRCLKYYSITIDNSFKLDLEYAPGERLDASEHEISHTEMDMIYLQEPVINLFEILSQQVFLTIPGKRLCAESCRGLCPRCGTNLNIESCDCKPEFKSSPFAVLKKK